MSDDRENEPKQTTPKGMEIPVPKRDEFLRNIEKVTRADPDAKPDDDEPATA